MENVGCEYLHLFLHPSQSCAILRKTLQATPNTLSSGALAHFEGPSVLPAALKTRLILEGQSPTHIQASKGLATAHKEACSNWSKVKRGKASHPPRSRDLAL